MSERAARAYLLWGDDTPSRDELVRGFRTRMLARPGGALNLSEFQAPNVSAAEIIAACDTVPFLDDRRLVMVHQLFGWRARQAARRRAEGEARPEAGGLRAEREQLLAYLPRLAPQTTLVLVEPQLSPPLLAEITGALPAGRRDVRAFGAPRGAELERWLAVRARRRQGALAPGVASLLRQHGPASLEALDQEIAKLVTYAAGEAVSVADLRELLAGSEIVVFELLDALAEGRQGDALAAYRRLLRQGGRAEELAPQIIALYRRLLICRLALEERASLPEVQAAHGVKLIDKLRGQARGWSSGSLRQALGLLLALDRRLKRGETEAEAGLEVAIGQLAGLHQAGAGASA